MTELVEPLAVAVALFCILLGEYFHTRAGIETTAPISSASAAGIILIPFTVGVPIVRTGLLVLAVVTVGMALGYLLRVVRRLPRRAVDFGARYLAAAVTILCCYGLPPVRTWLAGIGGAETAVAIRALVFVLISTLAGMIDILVRVASRAQHWQISVPVVLRVYWGPGLRLGGAVVASGASIAMAYPVLGALDAYLFLWPLVMALVGLDRLRRVEVTARESVLALSRLTEATGLTQVGHAAEVSKLAMDLGRRLRLPAQEIDALRYAGLLHDVGQLALPMPVPDGATVYAAPADQQNIADHSVEIAGRVGADDEVLALLRQQAIPYRRVREFGEPVSIGARILKVANAYVDLGGMRPGRANTAMERIHLGLGYEYDPTVVEVLEQLTNRQGTGSAPQGWVDVRRR
ncbi:MAG: HD-GYP domain-containing protein [Nostocoides sp.]